MLDKNKYISEDCTLEVFIQPINPPSQRIMLHTTISRIFVTIPS